jgi:hypothetical protein
MIDISSVVSGPVFQAPRPFQVLRSTGTWAAGGFKSQVTATLELTGPVQQATDKEVSMLPEGDRVGQVMAFWCTVPVYVTRGKLPLPTLHTETPKGVRPGLSFTLSSVPLGQLALYKNGHFLEPSGVDYTQSGSSLSLDAVVGMNDVLMAQWPVVTPAAPAAADILVYDGEQYRLLDVRHYAGSGYWKALATRMSAA